jgi:hypothetical protein
MKTAIYITSSVIEVSTGLQVSVFPPDSCPDFLFLLASVTWLGRILVETAKDVTRTE